MSWPTIAYIASVAFMAVVMLAAMAVIIGEPLRRRGQIWAVLMGYIERKNRK